MPNAKAWLGAGLGPFNQVIKLFILLKPKESHFLAQKRIFNGLSETFFQSGIVCESDQLQCVFRKFQIWLSWELYSQVTITLTLI